MTSYFAASCLLHDAVAADYPPSSDRELLPGAPTAAAHGLAAQQSDDRKLLRLKQKAAHELTRQKLDLVTSQNPWLASAGQVTHQSANYSASLSRDSQQLIRALRNASVHGLDPDSYGLSKILRTVRALSGLEQPSMWNGHLLHTSQVSDSQRLRELLSAQMDHAFVRLATHLGQGVVDALSTQRGLFREVPKVNSEHLLESVWSGQKSAMQALKSVTPAQAEYRRLTTRMRDLLTERAAGIERPVIGHHDTLSVSMSHGDVMAVKHRLMETGELPSSTVLSPLFDADLKAALRQFQQRHGLEPDGAVSMLTRTALNLSIDDEIRAVALSLERWRWMPRDLGQRHLYINIPDYRVVFHDGPEKRMSMVAVVGSVEHQTPTFSRDMSYIEFNPTWTVPSSITNEELIPKERDQPGYLMSRQFDFLKRVNDQLVVVPPEMVTADDLRREPFAYTLRQRSGAMNDLGRMKFMMPNPHAIYLHDTLAKKHFFLNERAYSHGCIRLSDPDGMAKLLMTEDGYSPDDIRQALQNPRTHRVPIRVPIPTHLTYMTTWIDADGILQRRPDIYQHDAALMNALQSSDSLLSTLNQPTASLDGPGLVARGEI